MKKVITIVSLYFLVVLQSTSVNAATELTTPHPRIWLDENTLAQIKALKDISNSGGKLLLFEQCPR